MTVAASSPDGAAVRDPSPDGCAAEASAADGAPSPDGCAAGASADDGAAAGASPADGFAVEPPADGFAVELSADGFATFSVGLGVTVTGSSISSSTSVVLETEYTEEGTKITAECDQTTADQAEKELMR